MYDSSTDRIVAMLEALPAYVVGASVARRRDAARLLASPSTPAPFAQKSSSPRTAGGATVFTVRLNKNLPEQS